MAENLSPNFYKKVGESFRAMDSYLDLPSSNSGIHHIHVQLTYSLIQHDITYQIIYKLKNTSQET